MAAATRRASCRSSIVQQLPNERLPPLLVVELHRQADDVVTLLGEQRRRDRRVDAARHGDDNPHVEIPDTSIRLFAGYRRHGQPAACRPAAAASATDAIDFVLVVETGPRLKRSEFCVRCVGRPIARSTCDGSSVPDEQADPVDTANPFEVERDQQALGLDAVEADVGRVRHARRRARR